LELLITTGLVVWFDANDINSITKDSNNKISQWNDKSTTGANVTQSNDNYKPVYDAIGINNKPCIIFSPLGDQPADSIALDVDLSANILSNETTVFIVMHPDTVKGTIINQGFTISGGNEYGWGVSRGSMHYGTEIPDNSLSWASNSNSDNNEHGVASEFIAPNTTVLQLVHITKKDTTIKLFNNNILSNTDTIANANIGDGTDKTLSIGRNCDQYFKHPFSGKIGEIIIFNRELSDTEIQSVNFYLVNKWLMTDLITVNAP
jgi:hypothetical protein